MPLTGWKLAGVLALDALLFCAAALTGSVIALAVTGVVTVAVLIAVIVERDRVAGQVQAAQTAAETMLAQRSALGHIATVIAHQQAPEKVHELVCTYAAQLIGGTGARLEPIAAGTPNAPGQVQAIVMAGQEKWGLLRVDGLTETDLPAARRQLLQQFADLAGLSVASARTRAQLLTEARTDPLTGLANQRAFHRELAEELSRAKRHDRCLALILLDLDGFKRVNDREGPVAGDFALTEMATRIRGALRLEAHVARLGGDELAILLPECDAHGGYVTAERVRRTVAAEPTAGGTDLTVSVGVAALEPSGEAGVNASGTADDLIVAADAALYAAKRIGGNTTVRFTPKLSPRSAVAPEARRTAQPGAVPTA